MLGDFLILQDFGLIVLAAAILLLVARSLRVPALIAYIVAGLIVGPVTGLVHVNESIELIAEVGIALLLFLVGLELSLEKVRDVGRVAVFAGLGQITLTAAFGYALALLLDFAPLEAGLLAVALAFSSTVVVVKLLQGRGELTATHGRIAISILLVQDVAVAVVLTLLAGLGGQDTLNLGSVGRGLLDAFLGMGALVLLAVVATRFVLRPLFHWIARLPEALFIWSLAWAFLFILAADALSLSIEIGAFVAGVMLAQLPYNESLIRRVHPLVNFFLAVFFVSLGIHMEAGAALARWPAIVALSLFVLVGKPAILMALIPRFGYGERTSFLASLTLGQTSEFSFILAGLALGTGVVDEAFVSVTGLTGLVTIGVSAVLIHGGEGIYRVLRGAALLGPFGAVRQEEQPAVDLRGHVIVVGMNTLGRTIVQRFTEAGETVLAVDSDPAKLVGLPARTLQGNTRDYAVLEEANLAGAKLVVSALQIEDANNLIAYRCRRLGIPVSIHAFDPVLVDELKEHGATHLMVSKFDGTRQVVEELRREGVLD